MNPKNKAEMNIGQRNTSRSRLSFAACLLCLLLHGCTVVGPEAIRSGRLAYNEAIAETDNQQMLMVLVHNRYNERNHLLAVSSVTANVRMSSNAKVELGLGDSSTYDGNLVPLSGGFVYEENPTISYTPVRGEAYLGQVMSPLPLSVFYRIARSSPDPTFVHTMLLSSVNGIRNPGFLLGAQQEDPRFDQFTALIKKLTLEQALRWARPSGKPERYALIIDAHSDHTAALATELLELLGIPLTNKPMDGLSLPVSLEDAGTQSHGITITTRSIWELVELLSAAVEVPSYDVKSGVVEDFPRRGRAGRGIRVRFSNTRPERAYIAVEHRAGWFYLDDNDRHTKRYFKLLGNLWAATMAGSLNTTNSSPVLTVPVSR